jgi:hypothetical protein
MLVSVVVQQVLFGHVFIVRVRYDGQSQVLVCAYDSELLVDFEFLESFNLVGFSILLSDLIDYVLWLV